MAATLSASYLSSKVRVGDKAFIGISIDTYGQLIDGIDVMLTTSAKLPPVAYIPMSLLPVKPAHQMLLDGINFSQVTNGGQRLAVKGLIAVIECEALATGYANLKFNFTLGATNDTNIASNGVDILTSVVNKRITVIA